MSWLVDGAVPNADVFDRRRLFGTAIAAAAGAATFPSGAWETLVGDTSSDTAAALLPELAPRSSAPWTAYYGAVQDTPGWASAQRGGNFTDLSGRVRVGAVRAHLQSHDLLSWGPPHPSQTSSQGVAAFMNWVRRSGGRWWRSRSYRFAADLIAAHRPTPRKVIGIQLGNEISATGYRQKIQRWARSEGLPFPHPRSNYRDGDSWYSRDHIGYYVEYLFAPAAQALRSANRRAEEAHRIPIVLGSVVGARHPFVVDKFLPALLNYRIGGRFAPALAGMQVKSLVRYVAVHYLLTPEKIFGYVDDHGVPLPYGYRRALDELHDRWVGNGAIRGIWHTEEGGKLAQVEDRHASLALRVFARTTSWALDRGVPPGQLKMFGMYKPPPGGWGSYEPRRVTSWSFAMEVVNRFLGRRARLINRSSGMSVSVTDRVERYAFETADRTRRMLLVTPQTATWQGRTVVRSVSFRADGWTTPGSQISAVAHLFKSDAQGYRRFAVVARRHADRRRYTITLPDPIALNANDELRVLMIHLRRQ